MKKTYVLIITLLSYLSIYAQFTSNELVETSTTGSIVEVFIRVQTSTNQAVPFCKISLVKKVSGGSFLKGITNKKGVVQFNLTKGSSYSVNFENIKDYLTIVIPDESYIYTLRTVVYNPPLTTGLAQKLILPDTLVQNLSPDENPTDKEAIVKIQLLDDKNRVTANHWLRVFNKDLNKVFTAKTGQTGEATFLLPIGRKYDVGVDEFENFETLEVRNLPNSGMGIGLLYVPTSITENMRNDTIFQVLPANIEPTTSRVLVKHTVWDLEDKLLPNEMVCFDVTGNKQVYCAKTDSSGIAYFLLPKGELYSLNLKYERDIDKFEYPLRPNLHTTEIESHYMGTAKIEAHFRQAKIDADGFKTDFLESRIKPGEFDMKWIEKTENGYNINFSQSDILSPLFVDNQLLSGNGYYNRDYFSVDAKTGTPRWGITLADNGPSAALYSAGVVVMITESCTLYAIDAITGKLLWSKWLSPYMYSTPSVADGKVIAVYQAKSNFLTKIGREPYVIVAFDLKTGKIVWQNRLDAETFGAPVFYKESVYLTTLSGSLYQFDQQTGAIKNSAKGIKAVSSPTVYDENLIISLRSNKDSMRQEVCLFNRNTLKLTKRFANLAGIVTFNAPKEIGASKLMSYEGSRVVHYKGRNYNVMDDKLICSGAAGEIIWAKNFGKAGYDFNSMKTPLASMPVISNGNILISTFWGEIQIYNAQNGVLKKKFDTGNQLFSQVVLNNGWIYSGSNSGKVININSGMPELTGWTMWNYNPEHNPVIK